VRLETVRVKFDNEHGYLTINKSDMTDDHTIWTEDVASDEPKEGSVPWLKAQLKEKGVDLDGSELKADLVTLLAAAE